MDARFTYLTPQRQKMAIRNQSIRNDRAAGMSIRELIGKYDLSGRHIQSICAVEEIKQ